MQYFGTIETKYEEVFLTESYMYFNAEGEEITAKENWEKAQQFFTVFFETKKAKASCCTAP